LLRGHVFSFGSFAGRRGLRVVLLSPGQGIKDYGKKPVDTLDNQIAHFIIVTARSSP
jgi:hypothetical protein